MLYQKHLTKLFILKRCNEPNIAPTYKKQEKQAAMFHVEIRSAKSRMK